MMLPASNSLKYLELIENEVEETFHSIVFYIWFIEAWRMSHHAANFGCEESLLAKQMGTNEQ